MTRDDFSARVKENEKKLYLYALSVVRNTEDAKDAVAEAVAYAWEKLSSLKNEDSFDVWLLKITQREAVELKKKRRAYVDVDELSDAFSYETDTSDLEFLDILCRAGLDKKTNVILTMRFMYGHTLEETADKTGIPLSTVKTKYYRALDKLSKILKPD